MAERPPYRDDASDWGTRVNPIIAKALALQLPVFPCNSRKAPAIGSKAGGQGFHDASADLATIKRLFSHPNARLIGVPTGIITGFDVLDIDPRHGGEKWWLANRHRIPPTRMHRTHSGGLHAFFQHVEPVRNTESTLAKGADTRGQGGYVVWWPAEGCQTVQAPIAPWPAWLLDALLAPPPRPPPRPYSRPALNPDDAAQRIAARALDRLAAAPPGQRHYTLRKTAYTLGGLLDRLPFSDAEALQRLCDAAQQAGAEDMANATRTAIWGLQRGRDAPLTMERR